MELGEDQLRERVHDLFRYAEVGRCVSGITHDINNYLGAMMAYAELLGLEEGVSEEAQKMLNQIVETSARCSELINRLTVVARPKLSNESALDLASLVQSVAGLRSYEHKVAGIKTELDLPAESYTIVADLPKLQMALIHLLLNAYEAVREAPDRCIRIRVKRGPECSEVEIWNSGPELGVEEAERLFLPFSTTKDTPHLGLGLYAARQIAEYHGGSLRYEADRGFVLFLPDQAPQVAHN